MERKPTAGYDYRVGDLFVAARHEMTGITGEGAPWYVLSQVRQPRGWAIPCATYEEATAYRDGHQRMVYLP